MPGFAMTVYCIDVDWLPANEDDDCKVSYRPCIRCSPGT